MILLNRVLTITSLERLWLSRSSIALSILLSNSFFLFGISFINSTKKFIRKPLTYLLGSLSLLAIIASFSDLVLKKVKMEKNLLNADFGPLYGYVMLLIITLVLYLVSILWKKYKMSKDDLLKVQMKLIFYSLLSTFVLGVFSYVIIPLFYNGVTNLPIGPLSFIPLFIWLSYVISQKNKLFISIKFHRFLKILDLDAVNTISFANLVTNLAQGLKGNIEHSMKFNFESKARGTVIEVKLNPKPRLRVNFKNFDVKQLVTRDTHALNTKALLKQNNGALSSASNSNNSKIYRPNDYLTIIKKNIEYSLKFFGEELVFFSKASIKSLEYLIDFTPLRYPISLIGDKGTGKATMARALHFYRQGSNLSEISCYSPSIASSLEKDITKFLEMNDIGKPGLIIKDLQALSKENMHILESKLNLQRLNNRYLYFTATPEIYDKLGDSNKPGNIARDSYNITNQALKFSIDLSPLFYRKEDVFYQIMWFCLKKAPSMKRNITSISSSVISAALQYNWKGNSTELFDIFSRAIWDAHDGNITSIPNFQNNTGTITLSPLELSESKVIRQSLHANSYYKIRTAKELGISLNTLKSKIRKYKIKLAS